MTRFHWHVGSTAQWAFSIMEVERKHPCSALWDWKWHRESCWKIGHFSTLCKCNAKNAWRQSITVRSSQGRMLTYVSECLFPLLSWNHLHEGYYENVFFHTLGLLKHLEPCLPLCLCTNHFLHVWQCTCDKMCKHAVFHLIKTSVLSLPALLSTYLTFVYLTLCCRNAL